MHKKSFIRWYIDDGLREFFAIWKRLVIFMPRYFSVILLLRTLFSPWHKDVSLKDWRGFNPMMSMQKITWDLFSRIIGAIVRSTVIIFSLLMWILIMIGGAIAVFVYIVAPALWIISFIFFFSAYWVDAICVFVMAFGIPLFAYRIYRISGHKPYKQMDIVELHRQKWFYRVYERIGINNEDIPQNVLTDLDVFKKFLTQNDITIQEFEKIIAWEIEKQKEREEDARIFSAKKFLKKRPIGLNWHFGYTINLDRYADDLMNFGRREHVYTPFYGFSQEMKIVEVVLARPSENSVILTGEPGVGRHMIVHELARRIRSGYFANNFMKHMRVLKCDFMSIMAQARSVGDDPENIVHNLFHEAAYAGNVILVVDNFEQYTTEDNRNFSFAAIIDQYASLGSFRMIGIVTEEKFHEYIETNRVLTRHFDVVPVHEMDRNNAMRVLFTRFYGKDHTPFTYQALRRILENSERYTNTAPLPTRAIDLAMEVFVLWQKNSVGFITAETVDVFINEKTGVPVGKISQDERGQLLSLEESFHQRIIGQDAAVKTVASAVRRMRSGMTQPNKPAGSFLFLGPTGVGKTEMAKTVAEKYFGARDKVIRVDMSEFQGPNALARLIGSKELEQQGHFVSQVREHPYALLLLDEIEKANPLILDLFLQVLDEGFLHDAFGRKVSFTTMIIIATSNAGALTIKKMIDMGINPAEAEKKVIDAVTETGMFRPEFLNRFDDIVIFEPISGEDIPKVTQLLLEKFARRVQNEQHITLTFDENVVDEIVAKGFDPVFGARSLVHYIDDAVADALAKKLISGNVHRGDNVHFDMKDLDQN